MEYKICDISLHCHKRPKGLGVPYFSRTLHVSDRKAYNSTDHPQLLAVKSFMGKDGSFLSARAANF